MNCLNWACDYQNNNECCHQKGTCEIRIIPESEKLAFSASSPTSGSIGVLAGDMKFKKYNPDKQAMPAKMAVGQICVRQKPKNYNYVNQLKTYMRKAMEKGMEFSVYENDDEYAIRRDK